MASERIWVWVNGRDFHDTKTDESDIAYIRADIADERVKQARREVWDKAISAIPAVGVTFPNGYEEWVDAPSYKESVIAALETACAAEGGEGE